jgi:NADH:ubiquinone oxidoreductase subunit 2 (subunit N)
VNLLWIVGRSGPFGRFLTLVILVNTVISAFYYFRIVRVMYFEPAGSGQTKTSAWGGAVMSITCAAALVLSFVGFGPIYAVMSHVGLTGGH